MKNIPDLNKTVISASLEQAFPEVRDEFAWVVQKMLESWEFIQIDKILKGLSNLATMSPTELDTALLTKHLKSPIWLWLAWFIVDISMTNLNRWMPWLKPGIYIESRWQVISFPINTTPDNLPGYLTIDDLWDFIEQNPLWYRWWRTTIKHMAPASEILWTKDEQSHLDWWNTFKWDSWD